ncbi:hypothetical protein [Parashewanella tropica]|uniref:hypothetical protein n=1 Tax=Parashewanella tropica TaxID=2547970 RepID=UPI001478FB7D|nr:hypothetical protein [Parashewanella tropica]
MQLPLANASSMSNNQEDLSIAFERVKSSLGIIDVPSVHRDYIHQVIYLQELLEQMNKNLDQNLNISEVQNIEDELNAVDSSSSLGSRLTSDLVLLQQSYYKLPTKETAHILGRKAVGTAFIEQYTMSTLDSLNQNLKELKLGNVDDFLSISRKDYDELATLTTKYYQQATKLQRTSMDVGFDYEKYALAHIYSPLDKFYK